MTDFDIIVKEGVIVDGTGNPWFRSDIGINNERIENIGKIEASAHRVIKARGLVVSPGFIDTHSHSDLALLKNPFSEAKIRQGVTTEVLGQDGLSVAPVSDESKQILKKLLVGLAGELEEWTWMSVSEYLDRIEGKGTAVNVVTLVGHGTLRTAVMGFEDRRPTNEELDEMKRLTKESILDGAFGISSGLVYVPSCYADSQELVELSKIASKYGGIYVTHLRGEGENIIEALKEAITIGRKAGLPVHVSHHKVVGEENWGMVTETLKMIDEERKRGLDITCDQYPYTAGSTMLSAVIPPWGHRGGPDELIERLKDDEMRKKLKEDMISGLPDWSGFYKVAGWQNIVITYCKKKKEYEGKTVVEIAEHEQKDPFETVFDLLVEEECVPSMVIFHISESDMFTVMRQPFVMIATDGLLGGKPHPRAYGTYARILGRYVREEKRLRLEEAIRKMTSLPAQRLSLWDRGLLRRGMFADLVIFDLEEIIDTASYSEPRQYPKGIVYVLVNGKVVVEKGRRLDVLEGKVLRKHSRYG